MHKTVIITCYIVFVSFAFSRVLHIPEHLKHEKNENRSSEKITAGGSHLINRNKSDNRSENNHQSNTINNASESEVSNKSTKAIANLKNERLLHYNKALESIPILQKIHARITRSKDAVWATITLTFICVLLVLAVAQSRMWKDHYYVETQGVPLPNFNERVLFKDVMEHKISTMKKFFKKKKSKQKDVTELESLLPPSEWDN